VLKLEPDPDCPDILWFEWPLLSERATLPCSISQLIASSEAVISSGYKSTMFAPAPAWWSDLNVSPAVAFFQMISWMLGYLDWSLDELIPT